MAKVQGPLFSLSALGGYAGALVFSVWKGRNTVRQLVRPSNPNSADQEEARNRVRCAGTAQKWANATSLVESGESETDKARMQGAVPSGFAWNGWLVDNMIGAGGITYDAAQTAYAALDAGEQTAWETAAAALTPAFPATAQTAAGGGSTTALSDGEGYFIYRYGLMSAGLATTPDATPPTYA